METGYGRTYKTCQQAETERALEMLKQGVITAPEKERDFLQASTISMVLGKALSSRENILRRQSVRKTTMLC